MAGLGFSVLPQCPLPPPEIKAAYAASEPLLFSLLLLGRLIGSGALTLAFIPEGRFLPLDPLPAPTSGREKPVESFQPRIRTITFFDGAN